MSEPDGRPRGQNLRIGLGVATVGRAKVLRSVLEDVESQALLPDRIIICHTVQADLGDLTAENLAVSVPVHIIRTEPGLPRQRNAILDASDDLDVLLFIDDDFLMSRNYLATVNDVLGRLPQLVVATGTLIHDDVKGPGLSFEAGRALIERDRICHGDAPVRSWDRAPHAYGCNMAIRLATVRALDLRFDERLPLYGWSEDMDFTHRIARHGTIAKLHGARGVHLGVKQGRSSGRRLGYSQVANPIYLLRKGSYTTARACGSVSRNLAANLLRAVWSEPYIDRRGRLLGNALAFLDMLRGRMQPERVLDL